MNNNKGLNIGEIILKNMFNTTLYLVYKTDSWHSYSSRDIIGIATSPQMAIQLCSEQAEKEGEIISETEMYNLANIKQTQGYSGDGEFQYETVEVDTLL